jgi:hypothetical protein
MFGLFTKRNKQKRLEREIEEVLDILLNIKPNPDKDNRTKLDMEIDNVLEIMQKERPETNEYSTMASNLEKLYKAKTNDNSKLDKYSKMTENLERLYKAKVNLKTESQIPWKEIVIGVFGLAQILVILKHEELNVITSKAFGHVMRGRV